jgi:hypothetical protein
LKKGDSGGFISPLDDNPREPNGQSEESKNLTAPFPNLNDISSQSLSLFLVSLLRFFSEGYSWFGGNGLLLFYVTPAWS